MGGVERYTFYLAKELVRLGMEVTVVTSLAPGLKPEEKADGVKIFRLPSWNFMSGRMPVLIPGETLKSAADKLAGMKFDYVLINTRFYTMSLFGAWFAKKNNIVSGVVEHGSGYLTFNNRALDVAEKVYEHAITAVLKRYCKNYYGVSKACTRWSRHFGIKPRGVLYNAVDIDEIEALISEPVCDYREKFGVNKDDVVITFTGRMIKEKGIYELIEGVTAMNSGEKIILFMAGDGPELERVKEAVGRKRSDNADIHCLGRIDFAHVAALLGQTDIYCLPSVSEGFPTSVLEAVAAKCFVVTTYNGGARELVEDGVSGTILKDNSPGHLREALERAAQDEDYRNEAAGKAYDRLRNEFTWEATAHKLIYYASKTSRNG